MPSSVMLRHVVLVRTDVSEECIASNIRSTRIGELGTLRAVSSGNLVMNEVSAIKFLGIQIDIKLNWRRHVEYILPKLSSGILVMSLSYFMSLKTL
jgi:hypothetical protein